MRSPPSNQLTRKCLLHTRQSYRYQVPIIYHMEQIMKIALIGATGNAGSRILAELSRRGHAVTAIARNIEKIPALPGAVPVKADAGDVKALAAALKGHEAVISSVHFTA